MAEKQITPAAEDLSPYQIVLRKDLPSNERIQALSRLDDFELHSLMAREVRELSARLSRAEARLDSQTATASTMQLLIAFFGLLCAFALSIWPYISFASVDVSIPPVISYLSAFVVVIFAYFLYISYRDLAALILYRKEARFIVKDGQRALKEAESTYAKMQDQMAAEKSFESLQ